MRSGGCHTPLSTGSMLPVACMRPAGARMPDALTVSLQDIITRHFVFTGPGIGAEAPGQVHVRLSRELGRQPATTRLLALVRRHARIACGTAEAAAGWRRSFLVTRVDVEPFKLRTAINPGPVGVAGRRFRHNPLVGQGQSPHQHRQRQGPHGCDWRRRNGTNWLLWAPPSHFPLAAHVARLFPL